MLEISFNLYGRSKWGPGVECFQKNQAHESWVIITGLSNRPQSILLERSKLFMIAELKKKDQVCLHIKEIKVSVF